LKNNSSINTQIKQTMKRVAKAKAVVVPFILAVTLNLAGCQTDGGASSNLRAKVDSLQNELKRFTDERAITDLRLAKFDSLDFDYYNNQKWDMLARSHADNIKCYYPDGSITNGLSSHIDQLKPMFVFAPDTKCKRHVAGFGNGDWAGVIEEVEGTFSMPMPIGNGKTIAPTGKHFKFLLGTVGRWGPDAKMTEEYLFWDNHSIMRQIGRAK
jgi:hypothetical protein